MRRGKHLITLALSMLTVAGCSLVFSYDDPVVQGCVADADCDDGNPCTLDRCDGAAVCVHQLLEGPAAEQTTGDCYTQVCILGAAEQQENAEDFEPDNPCTEQVCVSGLVQTTLLAVGTACADTTTAEGKCNAAGECEIECTAANEDAVCDDADSCTDDSCDLVTGVCVHAPLDNVPAAEQVDGDCKISLCLQGQLQPTSDNTDLPVDGKDCTDDLCSMGVPSNPPRPAGDVCAENGGSFCNGDPATPSCEECGIDTNCPGPQVCLPSWVCCLPDSCAGLGLTCGMPADSCGGQINCNGQQDGSESDIDCGGPIAACSTRCQNGQTCNVGTDCASGICADGVCCDLNCSGLCESCDLVASEGTCTPAPLGTDPDNECPGMTTCDGAGMCQ